MLTITLILCLVTVENGLSGNSYSYHLNRERFAGISLQGATQRRSSVGTNSFNLPGVPLLCAQRIGGHLKTTLQILLLAAVSLGMTDAFAQKVKVGYDKGTDFSQFKTYTWAEPAMPATRPVLFEALIARADVELQSKGLSRVPSGGDLSVRPSGGVDFSVAGEASTPYSPTYGGPPPVLNATMWTGPMGTSTAGSYVPEGRFVLTFVDKSSNKVVWSGSVKQKLDMQKKTKSLELADKAVIKLLKDFPGSK